MQNQGVRRIKTFSLAGLVHYIVSQTSPSLKIPAGQKLPAAPAACCLHCRINLPGANQVINQPWGEATAVSSRPQPCQHSVLVSYLQAGLLRGCRACMQTSCCSCDFNLAFRMWTTEVLKILVGEAKHLHAPPCTSHSVQAAGRKHITTPRWERHKDSCTPPGNAQPQPVILFKGLQAAVL